MQESAALAKSSALLLTDLAITLLIAFLCTNGKPSMHQDDK